VTTRESGAGLGVVLAYAAVERCGGEISFAPREGGGTLARIRLPLDTLTID
jgi:signal transduction histidine kinase